MNELESLRARVRALEDVNRRLEAAEAELRGREALIHRILDSVPGGIIHVGAQGDIRLANAPAQAFLGLKLDELTSRFTVDFSGETFHDDGSPCPVEDYPVTRCLVTGEAQPPTTIGVRQRSGEVRWAVFSALPVELPGGRGAVVTFVDITERLAAEKEREDMARRVSHAERLASLGTLAAGLAHEINNPLTFVTVNIDVARARLEDTEPGLAALLSEAAEGAERIARIVRDVGVFSRYDPPDRVAVDAAAAVERAVQLTRGETRTRARVAVDIEPGCTVSGQEPRLVQVLVNLLSNAARACGEDEPDAHVVRVVGRRHADTVEVRVIDDGVGMDDDEVAQAFVPFFTTRDVGEGSGLGLAISHGIVNSLGGTISLDSAPGRGTTVTVRLPAIDAPARAPANPDDPLATPPRTGLRILAIDDELEVHALLREALVDHTVTSAYGGQEGLNALADGEFDVILLDVAMPRTSGIEVLARLEAERPDLAARVLLVTGDAFTPRTRAFLEQTERPVLTKPFRLATLQRVVRSVAGR